MRAVCALFLALGLACAGLGAAPPSGAQRVDVSALAGVPTMDVSEIQPGMRGYGLTVFRGTQPERFEIEVIDILHRFRPDQDLILVRTMHPILTDAPTVGGMSGSPIYIDDRLIGAYAYGWPFGRHPVAGVTPIRSMLEELARPSRPTSFPGARPLGDAPQGGSGQRSSSGRRIRSPYLGAEPRGAFAALDDATRNVSTPRGDDATSLVPASTPMLVGGFEPSVVAMLGERLAPYGIDVLQAGGAGTMATAPTPGARFVDGGALAVTLARGDIASNVVGTVTRVTGDRLVAFGHPMIEAGETGFPTAVARVLHVLASVQRSFKLAEPIAPLGTLTQDRQAAIVVDQRLAPAMIPVRLRITGVPDARRTEWNFEVASHRAITPLVIFGSIASAVKAVAGDTDDVGFTATSRVWLDGRAAPVEVHDHGYSSSGPSGAPALQQIRAFDLLEVAFGNPFLETRPTRVEVEMALTFGHETAEIVDARVARTEVDPGETVDVTVVTRRYGRVEESRVVQVQIPESAAGDSVSILIEPGREVQPERPEARNVEDALEAVRERYGAREMLVSTRLSSRGLRLPGHVVRSLPASALDALQPVGDADRARPFVTHVRRSIPTDTVLTGGARVELQVRTAARGR